MNKILLINGPNLSQLSIRQPEVYGNLTLSDYENMAKEAASSFGLDLQCFNSESESEIIRVIHDANNKYEGLIVNLGALTHYSWAIGDALKGYRGKVIELHISNPAAREPYRQISVVASSGSGSIAGFGLLGYKIAVFALKELFEASGQ
jgi:3-dehydroquinate dehydratase-2